MQHFQRATLRCKQKTNEELLELGESHPNLAECEICSDHLESSIVFGMEAPVTLSDEQFARVLEHWNRLTPRRILTDQEVIAISHGSQLW